MKNSARSKKENVNSTNSAKVDQNVLDRLNAINIAEKVKEGKKSIFKKEFSNKKDRTKCRDKFQKSIQLYLLNLQKGKNEIAEKELQNAKEIAKMYYIAEDSFKNATDYFTDNMQEDKKEFIKVFVDFQN